MTFAEQEQRYQLLYERHRPRVFAYVLRRAPDPATAEDVVADVFLVAWRRLEDLPAACELPWLLGVARRLLANSHRSNRRRQRLLEQIRNVTSIDSKESSGDDPDHVLWEDREALSQALTRLSPVDAEILRLTAWEGLSHTEIAHIYDCTANVVAVRAHRARKRLVTALSQQDVPVVSGRTAKIGNLSV
jgi:RNA polymerase sigma factor (sigma-70 family)